MPALQTHYTFVKKTAVNQERKHFGAVVLGSQGPDPLFFVGQLPWIKRKNAKSANVFGSSLHHRDYSELYVAMIDYALKNEHKELLLDFIEGILMHYVLDRNCHPYVFSVTGFDLPNDEKIVGKYYMSYHTRIESAIDMIYAGNNGLYKKYNKDSLATVSDAELMEISKMWYFANEATFKYENIEPNTFYLGVKDYLSVMKFLNHARWFKRWFVKVFVGEYSSAYALIYPKDLKKRYGDIDFMNEKHEKDGNIGIKNSSFQYLFFVDADDLINVNYLNNISEKEYEDFIIFRSDIFTKIANDSKKELQVLNIEENVFEMYENENVLGVAMRSACGKIFDKKIIEEHNLFFDENLSFYEDAMFVSNYYQFVKQFIVYDNVIYHYRIYSGSSSKRFNKSYIGKYQMFFDKYKNNFFNNKHLMNSLYKDTLCSMTINKVIRSFKKFHYFYCFKIVKSQCVIESSKKIVEFDLYKNDFQRKLANKIIKRRYFSSVNLIIFDHFKKFIKVRFHK